MKEKTGNATAMVAAMLSRGVHCVVAEATNNGVPEGWNVIPSEIRQALIDTAQAVIDDPLTGAEKCHYKFVALMKEKGWKFGHLTSEKEKSCLLIAPYDSLSVNQRMFYKILAAVGRLVNEHNLTVVNGDSSEEIAKLKEWLAENQSAFEMLAAERDKLADKADELEMRCSGLVAKAEGLESCNAELQVRLEASRNSLQAMACGTDKGDVPPVGGATVQAGNKKK